MSMGALQFGHQASRDHFVEGEPTACFPDPVPAIVNGPESTNTPEVEVPLSENNIDLSNLKTTSVENVSTQESSGSISDKEIAYQSGILKTMRNMIDCGMLKKGDAVMVGKGFNIKEEIEELGLELIIPPNAPSGG
ncbi:hypothetical protein KUTeg_012721 [Tegillarca granosa]|uniref:Uncharacterized protein n=1 Tax=Tegillarca granosa TaxID=220873 RepID=A0ABQ9F3T7_TEGGR|nr:hypothetical protein KUTeg_012721 [Tegillarca granosa]